MTIADLLTGLEAISRGRADRVLRLRGVLPTECGGSEPFEVLIFRGFSSSVSHPTAFDPDQPLLPAAASIETAELLRGPLNPAAEERLAGPAAAHTFLDPLAWH
ncbi:hypothetical protein [Cyanobium sp. CH-040]|uniref:DUF7734 family protein n=1 Tax=Cyanobium sp. CH-040 TaxID=2823708 RepID=UPI0020CC1D1D|nr:hypothetical protein [Cyanobium sp. CH-040]MCP9927346.1 hypothetical protein [Cyanobium sp. CH-040]